MKALTETDKNLSWCCQGAVKELTDSNWNEALPVKSVTICVKCGGEAPSMNLIYDQPRLRIEKQPVNNFLIDPSASSNYRNRAYIFSPKIN